MDTTDRTHGVVGWGGNESTGTQRVNPRASDGSRSSRCVLLWSHPTMLQASNSNYAAAKAAKRKSLPRIHAKAVDALVAQIEAGTPATPTKAKAPAAPTKVKSAKEPGVTLKGPGSSWSATIRKARAKVKAKTEPRWTEPSINTPKIETPKIETPKIEAPAIETPTITTPVIETPTIAPIPQVQAEAKPRGPDVLDALTITIAVVLAVIAAYFSVSGMTRIFPGAELPVIVMTATMEAGKLTGAAWLSRYWSVMAISLRMVLCMLIVILALINAVGVFGQLSAAHLNPHVSAITANETEAATQGAKIEAQQRLLADLNRRISQIDSAIEEATKRGRSTSAMDLAKDQRRNRADLVEQRAKEESTLVELRTAQARITGEQQKAAADVGVLEYAATLFGVDREQMIQLLILAMVMSCDPLSITLVIATAAGKQKRRRD
jgi:hypothetical protein